MILYLVFLTMFGYLVLGFFFPLRFIVRIAFGSSLAQQKNLRRHPGFFNTNYITMPMSPKTRKSTFGWGALLNREEVSISSFASSAELLSHCGASSNSTPPLIFFGGLDFLRSESFIRIS